MKFVERSAQRIHVPLINPPIRVDGNNLAAWLDKAAQR